MTTMTTRNRHAMNHFWGSGLLCAAMLACGSPAGTKNGASAADGTTEQGNSIRSLDARHVLPFLFPRGRFGGGAYLWSEEMNTGADEWGVAIDTTITFTQDGMEKAALVMSHFERADNGERIKARIYLSSLSCAILAKNESGGWDTTAFKQRIMEINSDPWFMMPKVELAGPDNHVLRVASVIDMPGMSQEAVDVAYMDVRDLERVLSTTIREKATFLPSDKDWYDVEIQRPKGKVRQAYSETERKYVVPAKR